MTESKYVRFNSGTSHRFFLASVPVYTFSFRADDTNYRTASWLPLF